MHEAWKHDTSTTHEAFTVEVFVRPRSSSESWEQTVLAGGDEVLLCEGAGPSGCASAYPSHTNSVGGGFEIVLKKASCVGASCYSLGARLQLSANDKNKAHAHAHAATDLWPHPEAILNAREWHHVALTVGSSIAKLYVNASLVGQVKLGRGTWRGDRLRVGVSRAAANTGGALSADVDELAVYTRTVPQVIFVLRREAKACLHYNGDTPLYFCFTAFTANFTHYMCDICSIFGTMYGTSGVCTHARCIITPLSFKSHTNDA
jgi:hypothetical protein